MEQFMCSGKERLEHWRDFRRSLAELTEWEQVQAVNDWWNEAPLVNWVIDWDQPDSWPNAWDLVWRGDFCRSTVALLMDQTLANEPSGRWTTDRRELWLIRDTEHHVEHLVLLVDGKYLLNYDAKDIRNIDDVPQNLIIQAKYRASDKCYHIIK
jgi:hypothetical protein